MLTKPWLDALLLSDTKVVTNVKSTAISIANECQGVKKVGEIVRHYFSSEAHFVRHHRFCNTDDGNIYSEPTSKLTGKIYPDIRENFPSHLLIMCVLEHSVPLCACWGQSWSCFTTRDAKNYCVRNGVILGQNLRKIMWNTIFLEQNRNPRQLFSLHHVPKHILLRIAPFTRFLLTSNSLWTVIFPSILFVFFCSASDLGTYSLDPKALGDVFYGFFIWSAFELLFKVVQGRTQLVNSAICLRLRNVWRFVSAYFECRFSSATSNWPELGWGEQTLFYNTMTSFNASSGMVTACAVNSAFNSTRR